MVAEWQCPPPMPHKTFSLNFHNAIAHRHAVCSYQRFTSIGGISYTKIHRHPFSIMHSPSKCLAQTVDRIRYVTVGLWFWSCNESVLEIRSEIVKVLLAKWIDQEVGKEPWCELNASTGQNTGWFDAGYMDLSKESQKKALAGNDFWAMFPKSVSQKEGRFKFILHTYQQIFAYFLKKKNSLWRHSWKCAIIE